MCVTVKLLLLGQLINYLDKKYDDEYEQAADVDEALAYFERSFAMHVRTVQYKWKLHCTYVCQYDF